MEKNWERTLPFLEIDKHIVSILFTGILNIDDIVTIEPIDEGCRTSNYIIESSDNKKYVLKIFSSKEQKYKKECKILNSINCCDMIQEIYKFDTAKIINDNYYAIYKYIEGITLAQSLKQDQLISTQIVKSAADTLARIHKVRFNNIGFLDEKLSVTYKLKPLSMWYDEFLIDRVKNRLGQELTEKIKYLVHNSKDDLDELDKEARLVHGDFQGTNILIKDNDINGIIDWEFAMAGHPLADIGQFFRYEQYFNEHLISIFEAEYRKKSDYILPKNWYNLCKIRDLVNLIQLLGFEKDMPIKYRELKKIISDIISKC